MEQKQKKILIGFIWFVFVIPLFLPLILYMCKFGIDFYSTKEGWHSFASTMSGVYSIIIAFYAFLILIVQTINQEKMNAYQQSQLFISSSINDIDFYINLISIKLEKEIGESKTVRNELESVFGYLKREDLSKNNIKNIANNINKKHPELFNYWNAIYPLMKGLDAVKKYPYEHNFLACQNKLLSVLTFHTCVALDQFYSCISENRVVKAKDYYFFDFD